jgi:hypothetical protein
LGRNLNAGRAAQSPNENALVVEDRIARNILFQLRGTKTEKQRIADSAMICSGLCRNRKFIEIKPLVALTAWQRLS